MGGVYYPAVSGLSALFHGDHPRFNLSELTGVRGGGVGVSSSKSVVKEKQKITHCGNTFNLTIVEIETKSIPLTYILRYNLLPGPE